MAIAVLTAGVLLILPWAMFGRLEDVDGTVLAILELVAGGLLIWAWRGVRARRRTGRSLAIAAACFGLLVAGSVDASYRTFAFIGRSADTGTVRLPCGPFGLWAWHWDDDALARVRAAFPGHRVHLDERCQIVGHRDPTHEVRVTVGPFRAQGVATRLLVSEKVTYATHGHVDLAPYAGSAGALEAGRPCDGGGRCLRLDVDALPTPLRHALRYRHLTDFISSPNGAAP